MSSDDFGHKIAGVVCNDSRTPVGDYLYLGPLILEIPQMQSIKRLLKVQAEIASELTQGTWNHSAAEVLDSQGIQRSVIDWVLAGEEFASLRASS